jgi:hypothetical protein
MPTHPGTEQGIEGFGYAGRVRWGAGRIGAEFGAANAKKVFQVPAGRIPRAVSRPLGRCAVEFKRGNQLQLIYDPCLDRVSCKVGVPYILSVL